MTGQGPAVPLNQYIQMQQSVCIYQNMGSEVGSTPGQQNSGLNRRILELSVSICGHETQPPKKGGQYEIGTEYVKQEYKTVIMKDRK